MSYTERTIKRLFTRSQNECAMPKCTAFIIIEDTVVGEVCHIKARRKNGPRYDSELTLKQRNDFPNLILLCPTCHKLVDADENTYTVELLTDIKTIHEKKGFPEITKEISAMAAMLYQSLKPKTKVSATSGDNGASVAVGGDNHGNITINQKRGNTPRSKYPANSIGADANLSGYVEYLMERSYLYWKGIPNMAPGRIGRKIKTKFRLGKRTRSHLPVQRFHDLVNFIIQDIILPSPVGKKHMRNGTKPCRTFEEWKDGDM